MPGSQDRRTWRRRLRRLAGRSTAGTVALVTAKPEPSLAQQLGATEYAADDPELHVRLTADGPFDLIADVARGPRTAHRFEALVYHVRPEGTLAVRLPPKGPARRRLLARVSEVRDRQATGTVRPLGRLRDDRSPRQRDLDALALSLTDVRRRDDLVEAVSGVPTLARLTDAETSTWLELRGGPHRQLARLPARTFRSRCDLRTAPPDAVPAAAEFAVPEHFLRQFEAAVCRSRQAAHVDNVVLPVSFRHHTKRRPPNAQLLDWAPRFMRVADDEPEPEPLAGSWFLLDNYWRGHFGHALSEQVSLLWGWDLARSLDPDIRALTFARSTFPEVYAWEHELWAAYGITELHVGTAPLKVERLVTATPMFVQPDYVHPDLAEVYARLGAGLAARATDRRWPRRVFATRAGRRRGCRNADQLESWFTDAGFEVVRPEEHSLADQAELFRQAEVIAGYSGSNLFQIAFCGVPKHVITIAPESYFPLNEYLMSSVVGHRLDRIYCRPDVPRGEWFDSESYHSDFTFDPDREGVLLREVLAAL